jgi:hypothetical protein
MMRSAHDDNDGDDNDNNGNQGNIDHLSSFFSRHKMRPKPVERNDHRPTTRRRDNSTNMRRQKAARKISVSFGQYSSRSGTAPARGKRELVFRKLSSRTRTGSFFIKNERGEVCPDSDQRLDDDE